MREVDSFFQLAESSFAFVSGHLLAGSNHKAFKVTSRRMRNPITAIFSYLQISRVCRQKFAQSNGRAALPGPLQGLSSQGHGRRASLAP